MKAVYINGPEQADVFQNIVINLTISNVGDPTPGPFSGDIILTPNLVVGDADDVIVGSFSSPVLGTQYGNAAIPDLPAGNYNWALRVNAAPGEVNLANNVMFGQVVAVLKTDLDLDDDSPIVVNVDQNHVGTISEVVRVLNIGTTDGILVFNIIATPAVSWLSIDPPSSFAAGGSGNDVTLTFNSTGLEIGSYPTTVKFYNVVHSEDFKEVSVTLNVGKPRFWPGDRLRGQIDTPSEVDEVVFEGVEGEKVTFKVLPPTNSELAPKLTILDGLDNVVKTLTYKNLHKWQKKVVTLDRSGTLRLQVTGDANSVGVYKIRTSRKYPALARPRVVKVMSDASPTDVNFLGIMTGQLNFTVNPNTDFAGPTTLGYTPVVGGLFDLSSYTDPGTEDDTVVTQVPIGASGEGVIHISGFGSTGAPGAKVYLWPVQPVAGTARVIMQ